MTRSSPWISGIGLVSACGNDVPSTLATFTQGQRNFTRDFPFQTGIHQPGFIVTTPLANPGNQHAENRTFRLTMHAIHQALTDAKLQAIPPGTRVGICLGTTVACQLNSLPFYAAYRRGENPGLNRVYDFLNSNLAQAAARQLNVTGPRLTIVNACSSGTDAIGVAASWIRAGLCDIAIAGGADEMYTVPMSGFWSLGVMSTELCMPFDRDRSGLNLGEGAGIVILESQAFASTQGRSHQFQVAGYGSACDAYHLTAPHPQGRGLDAAIRSALTQANITPDQIAFINAHGTATLDNDRTEAIVLSNLFGPQVKFLSTKGYTGHTLGAAGGLEAVFTLLGLREKWIPASAGFKNKSDESALSPVTNRTAIQGDYALSTSLAFGGNNAALIIQRAASNAIETQNGRFSGSTQNPPLSILSIGAITPIGRDLKEISNSLVDPQSHAPTQNPLRVKDSDLILDPAYTPQLRRADRFTKMAIAAAVDAWNAARTSCVGILPERIGLFLCSGFGPHCRGFKFLDGIIDVGDSAASPTDFSHSVHGAASAYISRPLDLRGPSLNTTDFEIGFEEALRVAQCWLNQNLCDRILLGAVEELGEVFLWCAQRMIPVDRSITLGEGAVFLMLARSSVPGICHLDTDPVASNAKLAIVEDAIDFASAAVVSSFPTFGRSASSSAFNLLGAVLLQQSNPAIDTIVLPRTSSEGRSVTLRLEK